MKSLNAIWKQNRTPPRDRVTEAVKTCYDAALAAAKKGNASTVCRLSHELYPSQREKVIDALKVRYDIRATINDMNIAGLYGWAYE